MAEPGLVGFVVIEYNQASHWPDLSDATLFETWEEAATDAQRAERDTAESGRRETFAVARVVLAESAEEV